MADTVISLHGIGKRYRIGQLGPRYDTFREALIRGTRRAKSADEDSAENAFVWALRDVDLEISEGEVIGLIGRNGAGKTTLLRILSRITKPTVGSGELRGRVGSLLEVGTGFHPELTGRENVFLNGAVLGMRRSEIGRKFDEIVEFAGVQKFIDTPVKRYSSGMQVRLAFAVAAYLEPEILLVDEVLAVGDAAFQNRCLRKMDEVGRSGRTVILVSHSMPAIARLCDRAVLLHGGRVVADGESGAVVARYLQGEVGSPSQASWTPDDAPGDDLVRLREVAIVNQDGDVVENIDIRQPTGIRLEFDILRDGDPVVPQLMLTNEQGVHAFNALDPDPRWRSPSTIGAHATTAWIPGNLLNEGLMTVTVFLSTLSSGRTIQHVLQRDVVSFHIVDPVEGDSAKAYHVGGWFGAVRPLLRWTRDRELAEELRDVTVLRGDASVRS